MKIGHLIAIFALAALPFCVAFALYYPDERHYTDGALQMVKGHGWLVPETANGGPRLEKPPLAYWLIAACYKIFGVNVFASRFPFLLAACGTIFLTFRLARKLTGKSETALLAAVVLASQPQFFLCAMRSIPDALLVFFVTLSAFGFLRLMVFEEFSAGAFLMAYGGATGAALSKGLLGLLIIVFAWAFCLAKSRNWRAVNKLIHWPIFLVTMVLAAAWFVYIFCKMPEIAWRQFFGDQVTGNMHGHFWSPILRVPLFAGILLLNFLPWSATAIEFLFRRKTLENGNISAAGGNFILAWTMILILGFSLGANVSLRYLLPATPLMAILFADILMRAETFQLILSGGRLLKIALSLLAIAAIIVLYAGSQWPLPVFLPYTVCGLIIACVVALSVAVARKKSFALEALGVSILAAWLLAFFAIMPVAFPDRAQQIAATLRQNEISSKRPLLLIGDLKLASRLRVTLGKDWTVMQTNWLPKDLSQYNAVLISDWNLHLLGETGWKTQIAAASPAPPSFRKLVNAILSRHLPQALAPDSDKMILATRL
ncbi:MAG TPA: glycosyltransferase family 39 protein [Verrucomicrobiae bacterium]|nr:glycosyltransferase family 39 protein [Verrucomicrobiae bacterium]